MEYQIIVTVTGSNISLTIPIQDAIYNVTIHVYIHISVYSTSLSATREPEVKRRWIRLLEYIIGTFFVTRTAGFPFLKHA